MSPRPQTSIRNHLLSALPPEDLERLLPHFEPIPLILKQVLLEPNSTIEHVLFVESGVISLIVPVGDESRVEVGLAGREGLLGVPAILGVPRSPYRALVQAPGSGLRIAVGDLSQAMAAQPSLQVLLLRYVQTFMSQVQQTAACNGLHTIDERLPRWLLMCHDRVDGDDLPLTHEFLSQMLGIRRAGVTTALHLLEGVGIVHANRAHVVVRDRKKLEEVACECYGIVRRQYEEEMLPKAERPSGDGRASVN
jgi:CRP-like cAMP-binding protein